MKQQYQEKNLVWADDLRAFAIISVIVLHVSAKIVNGFGSVSVSDWWIGNVFDSLVRFCVPVFLMLTGALMLPKTYQLQAFFKKRISRILLPFLFWSVIYIIYTLYLKREHGIDMNGNQICNYFIYKLKAGASYHLWYVYMLIGIYLIIPLVSKWIVNSSEKEIFYYIIVWICVLLLNLPAINSFVPHIDFSYFSGYLGYPVLGYLLAHKIGSKRAKPIGITLFVVGVIVTLVGTYVSSHYDGAFNGYFYTYLSPNVIVASAGIFLFLRHYSIPLGKLRYFTNRISKYSFGIYLSHVFVLERLFDNGLIPSFVNPVIGIPCLVLACLILSFAITYLLHKIPFGRYIAG